MPRRQTAALAGAVACALLAAALWALAFRIEPSMWLDGAALHGFTRFDDTPVEPFADVLAWLANPLPFAVWTLALVRWAYARGGLRPAAAVLAVLIASNATTQGLKEILAELRVHELIEPGDVDAAAWPSGHGTASMSIALCAVLIAPAGLRPLVAAAGGLFAVGVGYSVCALGWHYPSDVLGGYLIAGAWACLGVAALDTAQRWPAVSARAAAVRSLDTLKPVLLTGAAVTGAVLLVGLIRIGSASEVTGHTVSFLLIAAAMGAAACALAGGLAAVLRR